VIETADRRLSHDAQTFWEHSTLDFGVLVGGTLATFFTAEKADKFAQTAIDSGKHRSVWLFVRSGPERGSYERVLERRVVSRPVLTERRTA